MAQHAMRTRHEQAPTRTLIVWLLRYALRRWAPALAMLSTMLLTVAIDVVKPWPMKLIVDHVLGGRAMEGWLGRLVTVIPGAQTRDGLLLWCIAALVGLFLCRWTIGLATAYASVAFGQRMVFDLAEDLFAHLQRLSLRFHSRKAIGDSIRRVTVDCGCVSVIVKDAALPLLTAIAGIVTMFGVMWRLDATLTVLALTVVPAMMVVLRLYANRMLDVSYRQQEAESKIYNVIDETLTAVPVVQAYGAEPRGDARFRAVTDATVRASEAAVRVQLQFKILMAATTAVGTAAIMWVGASHVLEGQLTVGSILVFLSYLRSLYGPLETVMYTPSTTQGAAGSARRVYEILQIDREVDDTPGARPLQVTAGQVVFEQVTFGYAPGRRVLEDVSFEARPGETIALVGPTGAGKSTLVSLLPRFYDPWTGRVLIDGQDVRQVTLESLRRQIALVLQEPFLFPVSLAENIAYGRPHATAGEVEAAARAANAHQFIERLPQGYHTIVGERGATLSAGERQRVSIARALLKDAPIVVLDEPTSAVDVETEALLMQAIVRLMRGRTTFLIAHRLSTIRRADRILVIQDGAIVDAGTHRQLLDRDGLYARLHRLQSAPVAVGSGAS